MVSNGCLDEPFTLENESPRHLISAGGYFIRQDRGWSLMVSSIWKINQLR